jgi:hypothetical protein
MVRHTCGEAVIAAPDLAIAMHGEPALNASDFIL